jgi:glycosyltransferase involved in cell wall biosynthesis
MPEIALATKVFSRAEKLEGLLASVADAPIETVYIADDGEPSAQKTELYEADYAFDLEVLDLEYDAGLGYGRNRIVEASDEPYLLIVDSDHEVPPDVDRLAAQLAARPDLGGVAGLLFERGKIRGTCHDLFQNDGVLVRDVREEKTVQRVASDPLVEYDFVPNVCLFRRACLEEHAWDPEYVIGKEHLDFYWTHACETDWSFGINPAVLFDHYPGGDDAYVTNRESAQKLAHSRAYFLDKWDLRTILLGRTDWTDATRRHRTPRHLVEQAAKSVLLSLPPDLQARLMDLRGAIRRRRNKPPL